MAPHRKLKTNNKTENRSKGGFVVAIDGPAGAGKSTVSRRLASALGGRLLDTGAMYRSVAYYALLEKVETEEEFGRIARSLKFDVHQKNQCLLVNGEDLGLKLRTKKVTKMASHVSKFKKVRDTLTKQQRTLGRRWSKRLAVVMEGRDIGSVVFPKIDFKFFVTAHAEVRADRRVKQLKKNGIRGVKLKAIMKEQKARDTQDSTRKIAPLTCPDDAVLVDTSEMGIDQVVRFMKTHIEGKVALEKGH